MAHPRLLRPPLRRRCPPQEPAPDETILLFISKWANYAYREKTPWLHDAQFGAWKALTDRHLPVRIICEDNLAEDLSAYRGLYVAFSPPELLPREDRGRLARLSATLPTILELGTIPDKGALTSAPPPLPQPHGGTITLDYPLAYHALHDADRDAVESLFASALAAVHLDR